MTMRILVLLLLVVPLGCSRAVEALPAVMVAGTPAQVYDRVLPKLQPHLAPKTHVIRIDENGAILCRFSLPDSEARLRMIEVRLEPVGGDGSRAQISSKRFSFLPSGRREPADRVAEEKVAELFKGA